MQEGLTVPRRSQRTGEQPLSAINVDGALLRLSTLAALAGLSTPTLYRDARSGLLKIVRYKNHCTRVRAEDARAYLNARAGGQA
jgi:hypothetical protein